MINNTVLYSLDDVTLVPSPISDINHRAECNIYDENGNLPIFTAPMDMVIDRQNRKIYENNKIIPILPRTIAPEKRLELCRFMWVAFGLDEFYSNFVENTPINPSGNTYYALIDIANGHMQIIQDYIRKAKEKASINEYKIVIMAGNVANPRTYKVLAEAGADYVRCSVGSGQCCITSSNTSVHYPMASLLEACRNLKKRHELTAKIVADGGINSYARAIKALALGADYVMIGTTLAKCYESAGEFVSADIDKRDIIEGFSLKDYNEKRFDPNISEQEKKEFISRYHPKKIIYGMSTKRAQLKIARAQGKTEVKLKTSEGIERTIDVEYTLHQWVENFCDYLRSAMSYCDAHTLEELKENANIMILSEGAKNSINK